jgi:hypothetical protein
MEEYDLLHDIPIDVTDTVTHEEFREGVKNRTHEFIPDGEASQFLRGGYRRAFYGLVVLYAVVPILVVPPIAVLRGNWWLVIGVVASYLGSLSATMKAGRSLITLLLVLFIVRWLMNGFEFYNNATFFFLCAFWGSVTFQIAESAQHHYALQTLTNDPDLFYRAIAMRKVRVYKKRTATP